MRDYSYTSDDFMVTLCWVVGCLVALAVVVLVIDCLLQAANMRAARRIAQRVLRAMGGDASARSIKTALEQYGYKLGRVEFYAMMAELWRLDIVEGYYKQKEISGQTVKQMWYRLVEK